jgi:cadmium resistance protein CadD (predicted permease)
VSDPTSTYALAEAVSVMGMTGAAFVSTNLDNLAILSAFGVKPGYRPLLIKLAFVFVCLMVLIISLVLSRAAEVLPADKIRFMGLIPICLGLYQVFQLFSGKGEEPSDPDAEAPRGGIAAYGSFALVMLANSGDSISVLTPLLADLKPSFVLAGFGAALTAAIAMSLLAHFLALRPTSKVWIQKFAKWVLPLVLVGIGLLILTDRPSDVFVGDFIYSFQDLG